MSQIAIYLLALNLWAVLVWAAASAFSRSAPGIAAWPGYWTGAVAIILLPWLAGFLVPDAALGLIGAGAGAVIDALAETAPRAASWAMDEAFAWAGMPVAEASAASDGALASLPVLVDPAGAAVADAIVAATAPAAQETPAALLPAAFAGPMTALAPAAEAATPWLSVFAVALVAVYGAGVVWTAGLRIGAHVRLRLLARGAPLQSAPGAAWPVYVAETSVPPCALGFPGRRILVPAHMLARIGEEELAMILRHESAHIERRDPETTLALSLVDALFWPNPAVRALIDRWRLAAEIRADQAVAAGQPQARRVAYARLLVSALRTVRGAPLAAPSAALRLDQKGSVKIRLAAILDSSSGGGGFASRLLAATAGVALASAGALGCAAIAQAAPRPAPEAPVTDSLLPAPVAEPVRLVPLPDPEPKESAPPAAQHAVAAADPAPVATRAADTAPHIASETPTRLAQQDSPEPEFIAPSAPAAPPYPSAPEFTPEMSAAERAEAMNVWRAERAEWEAARDAEREAWETEREEALAEWRESYAEWEAERAERERERQQALAEANAERQQAIQEAQAERQRAIQEAQAERQRAIQEAQAERQRAIQEAQAARQEWQAEMEQARDEWTQEFGEDWAGDWSSAWPDSWSQSWDAAALQDAVAEVQDWAAFGAEQGRIWGRYGARVGAIESRYGGMMGHVGALQGRVGALQGRLGALQGRRDVSEQERAALRAQLQEAQADLEEARADLDEAMAERERDLAELERELRRDLAELGVEAPAGFHPDYDHDYDIDPDGAAVSRILEGGPRE